MFIPDLGFRIRIFSHPVSRGQKVTGYRIPIRNTVGLKSIYQRIVFLGQVTVIIMSLHILIIVDLLYYYAVFLLLREF